MKKIVLWAFLVVAATTTAFGSGAPATLTVVNETQFPLAITINETISAVTARPAEPGENATMVLAPGADAAMRVRHGKWRIYGDDDTYMETRFHQGTTPVVHFRVYSHGRRYGLMAIVDDGYATQSGEISIFATPVAVAPPPEYPYYVDPRYNPPYVEQPDSAGGFLGEVVGDALTGLLDGLIHDDDDRRPPHGGWGPPDDGHRPPPGGWGPPDGGNRPPQGGWGPPDGGHRPPQGGWGPPDGGQRPPQGGWGPPDGGQRPPQGGHRPPQEEHRPPQGGHRPPQEEHRPPQGGHRPPQEEHRPPQIQFGPGIQHRR